MRLKLVNGAFSYGDKQVFESLNIEIEDGEIVAILGPNGCGKSTLLHCLRGNLRLREGEVLIDDRNALSMTVSELAQTMCCVTQEQTAIFSYPVIQTVLMGRAPHIGLFATPSREDIAMADEALKMVGIYHLRDRPYTQISGGERQLARIARALVQEPKLMLLDEPTSYLDFGNQALILETIMQLVEDKQISIVLTTHFPNHALMLSSRVALMSNGGFLAEGYASEVISEENLKQIYGVNVKIIPVRHLMPDSAGLVLPVLSHGDERGRKKSLTRRAK
jgi:iron complex transport system ATP-binding protein